MFIILTFMSLTVQIIPVLMLALMHLTIIAIVKLYMNKSVVMDTFVTHQLVDISVVENEQIIMQYYLRRPYLAVTEGCFGVPSE